MSDVILGAWHGGLGDNIQFSTLPEEFYKQQGRKTYLLDGSNFRNKGIYDLIWMFNPYVKGIKEGVRNAGDIPEIEYSNVVGNPIGNWEKLHGLEPTNKYPKIYYRPKTMAGYSDVYLVDFTSISISHDKEKLLNKLRDIRETYPDKRFLEVTFTEELGGEDRVHLCETDLEKLVVNNIFEYYDIMCGAAGLVALSSGASHMSSAAKAHHHSTLNSICIMEEKWYNHHVNRGNLFIFDNIDYQVI